MRSAAVLTIGNELVSGDVENTNGAWLARRLQALGVDVRLIAALRDEVDEIARFVQAQAPLVDFVLVTGGLGGTLDDVTREGIAGAFGVDQPEIPELAERLRERFARAPEYAARWAQIPAGSRPLENPLGGAPGFVLANVYVFPGLPAEMEAMFETVADDFRGEAPIAAWRRTYRTRESEIAAVLVEASERYPAVLLGSYPTFGEAGPHVEVVAKSTDAAELAAAVRWLERALEAAEP